MKRVINLSDHRYKERNFTVLESLPILNERHEDKREGEWYEYTDLTEITNKVARYDDGDGGFYRYYIAVKDWGYLDDPDDTEIKTDDIYIAVWEEYSHENEINL